VICLASDKRLCTQVEFIRVLDCEDRICEFNQEACRVEAFNGKKSLIRSFPSKFFPSQSSLFFFAHMCNLCVFCLQAKSGYVSLDSNPFELIEPGQEGGEDPCPHARTLEPISHKPYKTSKCRSSEC